MATKTPISPQKDKKPSNGLRIKELRLALKFTQDILYTIHEPFLVLDADHRIVKVNPAFYRTFKVSEEDTEGKLIYDLGNGQWDTSQLKELLESILTHHTTFKNYEVTYNFPIIGEKTMLLNARRIDSIQFILLAIEDITERRQLEKMIGQSEQRFRTLIERSADAIALVNNHGKVLYASPSTKNVLGYSQEELQNFENPFDLVPPDDKKKVTKLFELLLKKPFSTITAEYKLHHKNGKDIWIESIMTNLLEDPNIKAVVLNYRDIDHRKELETQKDDFIGIASHELKTPVTSIKAYTQLLKRQFQNQGDIKTTLSLEKMDAQLNKLTALISDLLDVTKIETGKLLFNMQWFDFDNMVQETVDDIRLTATTHEIQITGETKQTIYADRERIGLVLVNLLTNAVKYSPYANKIIVHLSTGGKIVTVEVKDFGIGIEKSKQKDVFKRFFRANYSDENTFPGLGLGLYIASEIIKRHGGKMWLKSEEGKGSTFYFFIPINGKSETKVQKGDVDAEVRHE